MPIQLDELLIQEFRSSVNGHYGFVMSQFSDVSGVNHWNCVCSCMDWIDVSVSFLNGARESQSENFGHRVMYFFSVITSVDIIVESINQLYRVFFKGSKSPYSGSRNFFPNRVFDMDDDAYFKEIRACFGAHPVNLKQEKHKKRWFASWPSESFNRKENVQEVFLYPCAVGDETINFGLNIDELRCYAQSRYGFLRDLISEIDRQFGEFCSIKCREIIPRSSECIEDVELVMLASKSRFDNQYYATTLSSIRRMLLASTGSANLFDDEMHYKKDLLLVVEEIRQNLQAMTINDLKTDEIVSPLCPFGEISYNVSKIYDWVEGGQGAIFSHHWDKVNDFTGMRYRLAPSDGKDVTLLKLNLLLRNFQGVKK